MKGLLKAGVALAFGLTLSGVAHADIKIATVGPMTGSNAQFGAQMKDGAQQAVTDINAKGGVLGQKLQLEIGDDACDPKQAVATANQMVADGIVFVAGHYCSGSSIPASSVYADGSVIQISPASTNPVYTDKRPGPGTFRVCGRDDAQGAVAGAYIAEKFKDKKIGIVDDKSAYGKGLADETRKALNAAGVKEVLDESYNAGESDYSALVSKLKGAGIEVLYDGGYQKEAGLIARQMHDQGMKTQLISGDALVSDDFWTITGDTGEGTLMTFAPDPRKNPAAADVVKEFQANNIDPEGYVLYTYAATQVWAQAATKAGSTDFQKVADALKGGTFDTVLGPITFDDKGDVKDAKYVWYIWHDGKYSEM